MPQNHKLTQKNGHLNPFLKNNFFLFKQANLIMHLILFYCTQIEIEMSARFIEGCKAIMVLNYL